jgi:hypothetical protein
MRAFWGLLLGVSTLLVVGMLWHYFAFDDARYHRTIVVLSEITRSGSPALGGAWYESRLIFEQRQHHSVYPEMPPIERSDFLYAY